MLARLVPERAAYPWRPGLPLALALLCVAPSARAQALPSPAAPVPARPAPAAPTPPDPSGPEASTRPLAEALRVVGGRCWNVSSLIAAVRAWLKRDEVDEQLAIEVRHLRGPPERVVFVVRRAGARASERVFSDMRLPCDDQRAAVALSIALSIDATLLLRADPPVVAEPAPTPAAPAPEPPPKPVPAEAPVRRAPVPRARPALPLWASLEAGAAFGALPTPAPLAALSLGVGPFHGASLRFGALATPEVGAGLGRGRVETQLVAGRGDGCLGTGPARLEGGGCVGLFYGRGTAKGSGFSPSQKDAFPWLAAALRVEARVAVAARVALVAGVDGFVALREVRLRVSDGQGAAVAERELSRFGLMAGAGVVVSLW